MNAIGKALVGVGCILGMGGASGVEAQGVEKDAILYLFLTPECRSAPEAAHTARTTLLKMGGKIRLRPVLLVRDYKKLTQLREGDPIQKALKELGPSLTKQADGVLFYEEDSKIRVTPPRGERIEPYHVHLIHRVAGETLDFVLHQNGEGLVELDLARFDAPEMIVVTSAALRFSERELPAEKETGRELEEILGAPYSMSFKLVPRDQLEVVTSLQSFRYEVKTELGKLLLMVQPFNRRDMLLTWIDATKTLGPLLKEDPYVYLRPEDGYVPPRILVDVVGKTGLWQRAGTWHTSEMAYRAKKGDDKTFAFRIPQKELIAFAPPPRLDLEIPREENGVSAPIKARFSGIEGDDKLAVVLAAGYPESSRKPDYRFRVQDHVVTKDDKQATYIVDLGGAVAPNRFPLTAALTHRFVQPWNLQGGFYRPRPAKGTATVSLEGSGFPKLHSRVVAPRYASHYDLVAFLGGSQGGRLRHLLADYYKRPDSGSTNEIPPPPGGGGGPGDDGGGGGGIPGGDPDPDDDPGDDGTPPPPGRGPTPTGAGAGGFGGGPNKGCGCGKPPMPGQPAPSCPRNHPCKGTCGVGCIPNGHCKNDKGGKITVQFDCPPKGKGCMKDASKGECHCPEHPWNMWDAMESIKSLFPNAADFSWFNAHGATAPCHVDTEVAKLRVSHWGNGFHMNHTWYSVAVNFHPCTGGEKIVKEDDDDDDDEKKDDPKYEGPKGGGAPPPPGSGRLVTLTGGPPGGAGAGGSGQGSASFVNDPNFTSYASGVASSIGAPVGSSIPTEVFSYDANALAQLAAITETEGAAALGDFRDTYDSGAGMGGDFLTDVDPAGYLDFFSFTPVAEALGLPAAGTGTGGTGPDPDPDPGCGALGIEFIMGIGLLSLILRRWSR